MQCATEAACVLKPDLKRDSVELDKLLIMMEETKQHNYQLLTASSSIFYASTCKSTRVCLNWWGGRQLRESFKVGYTELEQIRVGQKHEKYAPLIFSLKPFFAGARLLFGGG